MREIRIPEKKRILAKKKNKGNKKQLISLLLIGEEKKTHITLSEIYK